MKKQIVMTLTAVMMTFSAQAKHLCYLQKANGNEFKDTVTSEAIDFSTEKSIQWSRLVLRDGSVVTVEQFNQLMAGKTEDQIKALMQDMTLVGLSREAGPKKSISLYINGTSEKTGGANRPVFSVQGVSQQMTLASTTHQLLIGCMDVAQ